MMTEPAPDQALPAALRDGLTRSLKARDAEARSALRTAIAAIENAEAIATTDTRRPVTSADIAGASSGVGSTEAWRRTSRRNKVKFWIIPNGPWLSRCPRDLALDQW